MTRSTKFFIAACAAVTAFGLYSQNGGVKTVRQLKISDLTAVAESAVDSAELKKLMNVAGGFSSPNIYSGGSSPSVYTRGSSPGVYTGGSSPSIYTNSSSPGVYTRGSSPNIYTHGFSMNNVSGSDFPTPRLAL